MSSLSSTTDRVMDIISEVTGIGKAEIDTSANLRQDIVPTSLDQVTLFMALSEEFQTDIDEDQVQTISNVGELIEFVAARQKS